MAQRWRQHGRHVDRRRSITATGAAHAIIRRMRRRPRRLRPHTGPRHSLGHQQRLDAPEALTRLTLAEKANWDNVISNSIELSPMISYFRQLYIVC